MTVFTTANHSTYVLREGRMVRMGAPIYGRPQPIRGDSVRLLTPVVIGRPVVFRVTGETEVITTGVVTDVVN